MITIMILLTTIRRILVSSLRHGITIIFEKAAISSTTHLLSLAQFVGDLLMGLAVPVG